MDEAPSCDAGVSAQPDPTATQLPRGFAVRRSPGACADVFPLSDGRTGVVLSCCAEPAEADRMCSQIRDTLLRSGDPVHSLHGVDGTQLSALCAVIDATGVAYTTCGPLAAALVAPDTRAASAPDGRPVVCALAPGATVLLFTATLPDSADLLDGSAGLHPEQLAERVMSQAAEPAAAAVYRHPPEPMTITLPAVPANLAVSRGRLRQWLAEAGVDPQSCADVLLAVGEATANATEHSVLAADHQVCLTVNAAVSGNRLRLTVSDDGRWKPATVSHSHRGHGMHLMNALVDSVELTATPGGTTVAMLKELP